MENSIKQNFTEKVEDFTMNHSIVATAVTMAVGAVLWIPICAFCFHYIGKWQGKGMVKELADAGVLIGYNHN